MNLPSVIEITTHDHSSFIDLGRSSHKGTRKIHGKEISFGPEKSVLNKVIIQSRPNQVAMIVESGRAGLLLARDVNLLQDPIAKNEAMQIEIDVGKLAYCLAAVVDTERLRCRNKWRRAEVKAGKTIPGENISVDCRIGRVIDTCYFSAIIDIGRKVKGYIGTRKINRRKVAVAK